MTFHRGNNQFMKGRFIPSEVYGADFETDHDPECTHTWVCQWALSDGSKDGTLYGRTIDQFEDALMGLVKRKRHVCVYFHNLKFDSSFLMEKYDKWTKEGWTGEYLVRDGSPMNLKFTKGDMDFAIRDSMKKIPGSLDSIGKMIGIEKLKNPSDNDFEPGWSEKLDYELDSPDWDYVIHDARICASAMRTMHANHQDRLTASGQTYGNAKRRCNRNKENSGYSGKWDTRFVKLPLELDTYCRDAYYGGLNVSRHEGLNIATPNRPIVHEDIHSSYPTAMSFDPMPYGMPWGMNQPPEEWKGDRVTYIAT